MSEITFTISVPDIELSPDESVVSSNKAKLDKVFAEVSKIQKVVAALSSSNRSMCEHKKGKAYSDYGGGYSFDCPTCGHSS